MSDWEANYDDICAAREEDGVEDWNRIYRRLWDLGHGTWSVRHALGMLKSTLFTELWRYERICNPTPSFLVALAMRRGRTCEEIFAFLQDFLEGQALCQPHGREFDREHSVYVPVVTCLRSEREYHIPRSVAPATAWNKAYSPKTKFYDSWRVQAQPSESLTILGMRSWLDPSTMYRELHTIREDGEYTYGPLDPVLIEQGPKYYFDV